jgi:hypothetical protein
MKSGRKGEGGERRRQCDGGPAPAREGEGGMRMTLS